MDMGAIKEDIDAGLVKEENCMGQQLGAVEEVAPLPQATHSCFA